MSYRICWKAVRTGKIGHGTGIFPKDQADSLCESLNYNNQGWTFHWVELVDDATADELSQRDEDEHIYQRIVAEGLHCTKRGG